jgi:molecular chaperone GrpE
MAKRPEHAPGKEFVDPAQAGTAAPDDDAAMLAQLQAELDEAVEARKRALADFANYQRRAAQNERQAALGGEANVVRSILGVLDHFEMALDQDRKQMTIEQLLGGIRIVRDELVRVLESFDVQPIDPAVGDEFDPNMHQAVMQQPTRDIAPNGIVSVLQAGYKMGDIVLRPAKVSVATIDEEAGDDADV